MSQTYLHIQKQIDPFIAGEDALFNTVFNELQDIDKDYYRDLLKYIHHVLQKTENTSPDGVNVLHLHIQVNPDFSVKNLIGQFLIVRSFYRDYTRDDFSTKNENLQEEIAKIAREVNQGLFLPSDITKASENKIRQDRKDLRGKLRFYQSLNCDATLFPKTLMNLQTKTHRPLIELFKSNIYAFDLSAFSKVNSYVVLNTSNGLNDLDNYENLLNSLQNIILFDCERKSNFLEYRYDLLKEWNADYSTCFKNLLIVTFDKEEPNINRVKNATKLIRDRFQVPLNCCYVLTHEEFDHLVKNEKQNTANVSFYGDESSTFWDLFELEAGIRDLYELRSMRMLNIYSLAFDQRIKQYILNNIFSNAKKGFLSTDSIQALSACSSEDVRVLQDALSSALDLVAESNLLSQIKQYVSHDTTIVLPREVLNDDFLRNRIVDALNLSRRNKLASWENVDVHSDKPILILAYQDQGRFQYYFYPNLLESIFYNSPNVNVILFSPFFKSHYDWAKYNLLRDKCKYLSHPLRYEFFDLLKLEDQISSLKPKNADSTDWDLENEYNNTEGRPVVKVKFRGARSSRSFAKSDLFILNYKGQHTYRIERIEELMSIDLTEETVNIQHLDEIQEEINLYDKLNKLTNQEEELQIIQKQFEIEEKVPEKLWKVLLKKMTMLKGVGQTYSELDSYLKTKGLKMVSLSHFQNTWANPESEAITPLSKKVFIAICEHLGIPKTYFIIMQRIKNASKQATRHSTRQMNSLLKDLFNDACFDADSKPEEILKSRLEHYKKKHPLDEIGINEDNLLETLVTLVELIQPEIKTLEAETIELIEQ